MTVLQMVSHWPVELAAAGYVDNAGRTETTEHSSQVFDLASVTKPLFAYTILVAVEEGSLELDQPAGPPGATVRHLLAHASGMTDDPVVKLAGIERRRIYSSTGFDELGVVLAAASGLDPATYFHEGLVEPLGLKATSLVGSPASGGRSSVDDLLIVLNEWLHPTLISPQTLNEAVSGQFPTLNGVLPGYGRQEPNIWGLGFELRGNKSPHWTGSNNSPDTYGHFGRSGTFIWVDPVREVGCVALTNREFGSWAVPLWPRFSDQVLLETRAR